MGMFHIADPQGSLRAARALAQHMGGGRAWGSQRRVAVGFVLCGITCRSFDLSRFVALSSKAIGMCFSYLELVLKNKYTGSR